MSGRPVIIQKYGGSSVATIAKLEAIADRVVERYRGGNDVVVVVSAMGNRTDELLKMAREIMPEPPARELDMLLSTGERTTMSLLSIAIQKRGVESISFTGSQSGIITTDSHSHARIISVRPYRIQDELERGRIVIVAGFQGTSYKNEITTLGRGGSDMTAIALSGALGAEACEIYSDVDGVYTADPKVVLDARRLDEITSSEMLEMAQHGAKVLHDEAVLYAHRHQISLYAKKSHVKESSGTVIRPDGWPEYALEASKIRARAVVTAKKVIYVSLECSDKGAMLEAIAMCDGARVMEMSLSGGRFEGVVDIWNCADEEMVCDRLMSHSQGGEIRRDIGNVTVVGEDVGRTTSFVVETERLLRGAGVHVIGMFTQPNSITFVVAKSEIEAASRVLHEKV